MCRRFTAILFLTVAISSSCSNYGLDVVKIDKNLFVLPGEGGNSGVLITDSVVLVIDTKMKQGAERFSRWVQDRAEGKKIIIVNTHIHKDHTGGNHYYTNSEIIAGDYGTEFWLGSNTREDMPTTWLSDKRELDLGEEKVVIENIGQTHTYSDLIVYLKDRKVIFTGDVVLNGYHPYLDESVGANVDNYISAMDHMLFDYQVNTVVPGHGDVGGADVISSFKQYFQDMKDVSDNPDNADKIRKKYARYKSLPVNKAGFDLTLQYIRKSESLRY